MDQTVAVLPSSFFVGGPRLHPPHYDIVWLQDAIGHAAELRIFRTSGRSIRWILRFRTSYTRCTLHTGDWQYQSVVVHFGITRDAGIREQQGEGGRRSSLVLFGLRVNLVYFCIIFAWIPMDMGICGVNFPASRSAPPDAPRCSSCDPRPNRPERKRNLSAETLFMHEMFTALGFSIGKALLWPRRLEMTHQYYLQPHGLGGCVAIVF